MLHHGMARVCRQLPEKGYQLRGFETLYNGYSGRPLEAAVFFGPTYYQRLKHMVVRALSNKDRTAKPNYSLILYLYIFILSDWILAA